MKDSKQMNRLNCLEVRLNRGTTKQTHNAPIKKKKTTRTKQNRKETRG